MKHSINLEKRLRTSIILAILTIATIVWVVLFVQGRALRRMASQDSFLSVEQQLRSELTGIVDPIEQQLRQLQEWGIEDLFELERNDKSPLFFKPILRNLSNIDGVMVANNYGKELYFYHDNQSISVRKTEFTDPTSYDPRTKQWFIEAAHPDNIGKVIWSEPYLFSAKKGPGITASIAWRNQEGTISVIAFDVLLTSVNNLVQSIKIGNGGRVFLVNRNFDIFGINDSSTLKSTHEEKTLFTDWRTLTDTTLTKILSRDFRVEQPVSKGLYYLSTSKGKYWVKIMRVHTLLPQFGIFVAAPEKGLNERIEQQAFLLNIISILIVIIGIAALLFILYHSFYALRLIQNVGELNHIFSDSKDIDSFLENTVSVIAQFMRVPVCSIYLFDENNNQLILKGTQGLNKDLVGKTSLKYGEGLVGLTLKQLHSLRVTGASENSDFQPVKGLDEEAYESFLAVPITRGLHKIGVLVVQKRLKGSFTNRSVQTLEIIASQLTSVMETAGFLLTMFADESSYTPETPVISDLKSIKAKVAAPGYALGTVAIDHKRDIFKILKQIKWGTHFTMHEFDLAVDGTARDLERLQLSVEERLEDSAAMIFVAHLLMLKDNSFSGAIRTHIENGINPPEAVLHVSEELMRSFSMSTSKMIREKADDVKDLTVRLLSHLSPDINRQQEHDNRIVIARELYPSDILIMASEGVKGIILVSGGATSHLAILCRSLQIPLLLTTDADILSISPESELLLDATHGIAYIDPSEERVSRFRPLLASNIATPVGNRKNVQTTDGTAISIHANVNLITDISQAKHLKIEGIGLYRSEFPFMIRDSFPTESEQFTIYKKVADHIPHKEMTFRTLDIGGDKALSYHDGITEENPFLGLRAIRFSLKERDIFSHQLKAILRAGVNSELRIMFPMIQSVDEFIEARKEVHKTIEELQSNGIICHASPKIGMMVELPAAVTLIEKFAKVSDFFSIGTNDLIQYLLGVDRTNSEVASLYKPHHPAVLSAIAHVAEVAIKNKCDVSVCGDMAGSVAYIPFLLGCGVTKLSVDPVFIPRVQECVSAINLEDARAFTKALLKCDTISEAGEIVRQGV